jgi:hypothetical protein
MLRQPTPCDEFRLRRNSSVCSAETAPQTAIETRMKRGETGKAVGVILFRAGENSYAPASYTIYRLRIV